ncbi:MAG: FtsX-like permease family protein [Oscillospiraceae bacterium]|nr:FtsX-like permease family protein [Oscillospiraceae bacterium]
MFKTIFGLAFQGVKRRRRQSLLIFFVLLVSFTFAIILLSYTTSIAETNSQLRLDTYGSWYGAISDGIDSDIEYLESTEWVDDIGVSVNYGSASVMVGGLSQGSLKIGTADENLVDMGINLESGRMPSSSGEIAIEAASLNEVGYGASTGSNITLQWTFKNENSSVTVERTFNVVGVISEYTGLWDIGATLNTAIIPEEAIADILAEAEKSLGEITSLSTETTYFFTVKSGMESGVETDVNKYLYNTREGSAIRICTINSVLKMESEAAQTNMVYLVLILAITILAVVMIYILQMQVEVKRIVRFRSIGGSKWQLRALILTETLMLAIPAILLGTLLGFLGIKLLLSVSVYSGSVDVAVSIPWNYLLTALALWLVGILAVRMITFQVALSTPLTGRMGMQRSKNKVVVGFRRALIMLMATLLCISAVFTTVNLAEPVSEYNYWTSLWSYYISEVDGTVLRNEYSLPDLSEYEAEFLSLEGVTDFVGFNDFYAYVTTSDEESGDSVVVITMDWDDLQRYVDTTGIDQEAYESGESVIVQIASDRIDGTYYEMEAINVSTGETVTMYVTESEAVSVVPEENSDITISIDYNHFDSYHSAHGNTTLDESIFESSGLVSVDVNIGALQLIDSSETLVSLLQYDRSDRYSIENYNYYVICALPVLQEIVDQIPEGTQWWIENERFFRGQQEVGYNQGFIFTNLNAVDLGVDTAVTKLLSQIVYKSSTDLGPFEAAYYKLYNFREINYANAQVYQQSMIMTIISGVCIAVVVLLILVSTLRLETDSEKRRYGILQAIGMSKRQRNIELARRAVIRSVISIAVAVVSYLAYYLVMNISVIVEGTSPIAVLGTMFTTLAGYGLTVPVLIGILIIVFLITFAICFGSKLSINKYTIMEMLREDR